MGGQVLDLESIRILNRGIEQGREETVKALVYACKKLNGADSDAVEAVVSETRLSQEDAEQLVSKYW